MKCPNCGNVKHFLNYMVYYNKPKDVNKFQCNECGFDFTDDLLKDQEQEIMKRLEKAEKRLIEFENKMNVLEEFKKDVELRQRINSVRC